MPRARNASSAAFTPGIGATRVGSPLYGTSVISVPSRSRSTARTEASIGGDVHLRLFGSDVHLGALLEKLARFFFHARLGVLAHFLRNFHRTEMRSAHRTEVRHLCTWGWQRFIVEFTRAIVTHGQPKLIFPTEFE